MFHIAGYISPASKHQGLELSDPNPVIGEQLCCSVQQPTTCIIKSWTSILSPGTLRVTHQPPLQQVPHQELTPCQVLIEGLEI